MSKLLKIKDISPCIGSIIYGLDLSKPLESAVLAELRILWLRRKVLVFNDQQLTPQQHTDFTEQFGKLDQYPFLKSLDGYPYVAEILKLADEKVNFGGVWHSDTSYLKTPAAGASLYALEIPELGGDTIFCNMHQAYEALPDEIKNKIIHLTAVNSSAKRDVSNTRKHRIDDRGIKHAPEEIKHVHPVIRCHPETGEKVLFINEAHTVAIEGLSEFENDHLQSYLYQHARKPEFQCRLSWSVGMLVLWDNRSTHHYPINDYTGFQRLLHRVSLKGDVPVGVKTT